MKKLSPSLHQRKPEDGFAITGEMIIRFFLFFRVLKKDSGSDLIYIYIYTHTYGVNEIEYVFVMIFYVTYAHTSYEK